MQNKREKHIIYGVHVQDRLSRVPDVQALLTEYGCNIRSRIGLHHVDNNVCSHQGLILLEMFGDEAECRKLAAKLTALDGVEVQQMIFDHQPD
ncbi:MAG TPA: hypothetical protein PLP17_09275 [Oligoflexia bacterium]|nr:hypothetical protein [Oligoflexia bacterium]